VCSLTLDLDTQGRLRTRFLFVAQQLSAEEGKNGFRNSLLKSRQRSRQATKRITELRKNAHICRFQVMIYDSWSVANPPLKVYDYGCGCAWRAVNQCIFKAF